MEKIKACPLCKVGQLELDLDMDYSCPECEFYIRAIAANALFEARQQLAEAEEAVLKSWKAAGREHGGSYEYCKHCVTIVTDKRGHAPDCIVRKIEERRK